MEPFIPELLPLTGIDWPSHVQNIGKARTALGRYDGILSGFINPGLLMSPLMTQEAVLSSRIEGTQASLADILEYEAEPGKAIKESKLADIQEILNYRRAVEHAIQELEHRPLSLNLIRDIHSILMDSARGQNKAPGEFRRIQNWIGPPGADMARAAFVPPAPDIMMQALYNWENYIQAEEKDGLVQLAVIKAQFEIIHPFLDGNGRIGRILIPILLYAKKILTSPTFYLSSYLESNRDAYYASLKAISAEGDWNGWIAFFLTALSEQADINIAKAMKINDLYAKIRTLMPNLTNSQFAAQATDALFAAPILTVSSFMRRSGIPYGSAFRMINILRENRILDDLVKAQGRRAGRYIFKELLKLIG